MRDVFSAGGKKTIVVNGKTYKDLPRILVNVVQIYLPHIIEIINETDLDILLDKWGIDKELDVNINKLDLWISIVESEFNVSKPTIEVANLLRNKLIEIRASLK
jgi:hypothetical protein